MPASLPSAPPAAASPPSTPSTAPARPAARVVAPELIRLADSDGWRVVFPNGEEALVVHDDVRRHLMAHPDAAFAPLRATVVALARTRVIQDPEAVERITARLAARGEAIAVAPEPATEPAPEAATEPAGPPPLPPLPVDLTFTRYQREARRTTAYAEDAPAALQRERLAVAGLGLAGEAGEVAELVKKHLGHGQPLDLDRVEKELGDVLWYVSELASALGLDLNVVGHRNVQKLRQRHPHGFDPSYHQRHERALAAEVL